DAADQALFAPVESGRGRATEVDVEAVRPIPHRRIGPADADVPRLLARIQGQIQGLAAATPSFERQRLHHIEIAFLIAQFAKDAGRRAPPQLEAEVAGGFLVDVDHEIDLARTIVVEGALQAHAHGRRHLEQTGATDVAGGT